jgi:nucleoside-diphosphate-sugar epimerase
MGATGPRVLVNAGAVGIYGAMDDRPVDEGRAPGEGFLPQVCRQWEAAAEAASASGVRVVRLRLGVVLARDGGALPRMALPVRLFLGTRLGQGRQGLSWIHVDDLVRLILEAAANPACRGPVNATAPRPVSNETFTRTLAQRLRRPLLPVPPARASAFCWERWGWRCCWREPSSAPGRRSDWASPSSSSGWRMRWRTCSDPSDAFSEDLKVNYFAEGPIEDPMAVGPRDRLCWDRRSPSKATVGEACMMVNDDLF